MRKLALKNYEVGFGPEDTFVCPHCQEKTVIGGKPLTYNVVDSIIEVMMSPDLRLSAKEILERQAIAQRLMDCPDEEILLEEADYNKIYSAFEGITGFNRRDVELVRRVFEAPQVEVRAKESGG